MIFSLKKGSRPARGILWLSESSPSGKKFARPWCVGFKWIPKYSLLYEIQLSRQNINDQIFNQSLLLNESSDMISVRRIGYFSPGTGQGVNSDSVAQKLSGHFSFFSSALSVYKASQANVYQYQSESL